jgi:hypothetical protein
MDPDVTLAKLREHVRIMNDDSMSFSTRASHGEWLQEGFERLDAWLSNGGFKPADWACPDTLTEAVGPDLAEVLRPTPTASGANDRVIAGSEAVEYKERRRAPRRDERDRLAPVVWVLLALAGLVLILIGVLS